MGPSKDDIFVKRLISKIETIRKKFNCSKNTKKKENNIENTI